MSDRGQQLPPQVLEQAWYCLDALTFACVGSCSFAFCLTDLRGQELTEVKELITRSRRMNLRQQPDDIGHYHLVYDWP